MLPNILQVTNPSRAVKVAGLVALLFVLSACGKKQQSEPPLEDNVYDDSIEPAPTLTVPPSAIGLQEWLDTASARDAKPAVLRRLPRDQYEHFRLLFPDSLAIDALGITDSTHGLFSLALGIADTLRYPLGRAYVLARAFEGEISEMEVFTVPEPADQVMMLEDAIERIRAVLGATTATHRVVGGMKRVKLSPVSFPALESVRKRLADIFSPEGVASVLHTHGITEYSGNVWIREGAAVPAYDFDSAEPGTAVPTRRGFASTFRLGTGGSSGETLRVEYVFTVDGWKIGSIAGNRES